MQARIAISAPLHHEPHPQLQWIEVATSLQIPSFHIVGLPAPEVDEARERVRAAIEASGLAFPKRRVVLNLSPASIRKQGTSLDLAMALAVLSTQAPREIRNKSMRLAACGELGLDGTVKQTGQITRTLFAAWENEMPFLFLPRLERATAEESLELIQTTALMRDKSPPVLFFVSTLNEAWNCLKTGFETGREGLEGLLAQPAIEGAVPSSKPLPLPKGWASPKSIDTASTEKQPPGLLPLPPSLERIVGLSAAGGHHLLLLGPKGTGKSHVLEHLITLQPPPQPEIHLWQVLLSEMHQTVLGECTKNTVYPQETRSLRLRPVCRRVGVHVKPPALIGGTSGASLLPGEFTLAHGGLLVADELPEWPRDSREALREPLERGSITLSRKGMSLELPARFTLIANGNFCPCGGWPPHLPIPQSGPQNAPQYSNDSLAQANPCQCTPYERKRYLSKLSGPLLDRMDIVTVVDGAQGGATSAALPYLKLKEKILKTRALALSRWGKPSGQMSGAELESLFRQEHGSSLEKGSGILNGAATLRSRHKILRLSLTLSLWDEVCEPSAAHFLEASCYRAERLGL